LKTIAIIPSAGKGLRMRHTVPKQYIKFEGRPVVAYTLDAFERCELIDEVLLVVAPGDEEFCLNQIVEKFAFHKVLKIVIGGKRRQDSVYNGIKELDPDTDLVVVHDAVRPFVTPELISNAVGLVEGIDADGVVVGLPVKDTIKEVDKESFIVDTPKRESLWYAQTPQVFKKDILERAFAKAYSDNFYGTDEASIVERIGGRIKMIEGTYENIKITTREDLLIAEIMLRLARKKGKDESWHRI